MRILSYDKFNESKNPDEYTYMLLSRLQQDCEYFLGQGYGAEKHLWAGSVEAQITKMKELWNELPVKPEWLSLEGIEEYEREMLEIKNSEK